MLPGFCAGRPVGVAVDPRADGAARRSRGSRGRRSCPRRRARSPSPPPGRLVLDDRERGRAALHLEVGEIVVAERGERRVAHVQHVAGGRLRARDGEVPGEHEVAARDVRPLERLEDAPHRLPPPLDRLRARPLAVADHAEGERRLDPLARGGAQVAQRDDVAAALGEVLGRADEQRAARGLRRGAVDLGPDQLPLARLRVDQDDALPAVERPGDVGDRDELVALRGRARCRAPSGTTVICWPGLKPSARFQSRGSIRTPSLFARHPGARQREPAARLRPPVLLREVVVGERQQALAAAQRVAALRRRLGGRRDRGRHHPAASAAKNLRVIPLSSCSDRRGC